MNVGLADGTIRIVVGALLLLLSLIVESGNAGALIFALNLIGIFFVTTGIFKFCPVYKIFGKNTNKRK